jgi:alanine racemase
MRRVGIEVDQAAALARAVVDKPSLRLEGVWTHCANADDPDDPFTALQLDRFDAVLSQIRAGGVDPGLVHAANSAAAIAHPRSRHDLVRVGIAIYGLASSPKIAGSIDLRPAMTIRSEVSFVKEIAAGEGVSYGRAWISERPTRLATVPIGYADGIRRSAARVGAEVLVRGQRLPIVGNVTMDQLMLDCRDVPVEAGDEVILVGAQGDDRITADEWAERLDTVNYEIVCDLESRVTRRYL